MQAQLKAEFQGFAQAVGVSLKKLERELLDSIASTSRRLQGEQSRLRDIEHNLQVKLRAEREVRENETEGWRNRHANLAQELDSLVARRDREIAELRGKVDAINATREAEAAAVRAERGGLHEKAETLVKDVALLEAMMQTARRKGMQLEAHLAQAEGERDRLQATAEALRQQIRESDEALGEAVRSNEALREQMEVQRLDSQAANERELKLCRDMFEKRLEVTAQGYIQEQNDLAKRIRSFEETIGLKAGELQVMRENLADQNRRRDALQREVLMWKSQHELSQKMKTDVEREFGQFRQESVNGELRRLQEKHDELVAKKAELELRRAALIEEVQEAQSAVKAREAENAKRAKAVAALQRETAQEVQRTKGLLHEAESGLANAKAEAATMSQQMCERKDYLEQELARLTAELEAERREHDRKVQVERASCEGIKESVEKLRNEHRTAHKAAFDGPVQQISQLEGAISGIRSSSDAELTGLRQKSEKLRVRIEELEAELARLQAKLAQTEQEVQEGTARVSAAKANHRATKEALEREKHAKTEELQQAQRSIAQRQEQLKSMIRTGEDMRKRMLRDVEDARASKAKQKAEADHRVHALRSEYSMAIEDKDREHTAPGAFGSRDRIDELARENEKLKRFVSEHRHAASHIQNVGGQMQKTLSSMEGRAAELRRQLPR